MMFLSFRSLYFASFWVLHQLHLLWLMNYNDIEWLWGKGRLTTRSFWIHHLSRFFHTQISTSKNWSSNNQLILLMILPWFIRFILFCFSGCLPSKQKHLVLYVFLLAVREPGCYEESKGCQIQEIISFRRYSVSAMIGSIYIRRKILRWCHSAFRKLQKFIGLELLANFVNIEDMSHLGWCFETNTLPETNIDPGKWWLEDEFPFGRAPFSGANC